MKNIVCVLFFLFIIFQLFAQDNTSDDDYYFNIQIDTDETTDELIEKEPKESFKEKVEKNVNLELSVSNINQFEYYFVRDTTINRSNLFDINNYEYTLFADIRASIQFSKYFRIHCDDSLRFKRKGNELYNYIAEDHENDYKQGFENILRELYFQWMIPIRFPIQISFGRSFYSPGNSYLFTVFDDLAYEQTTIVPFLDTERIGVNILKFSMFFPHISFDIIYSPGIPESNSTTEFFNIQEEQRFFGNFKFKTKYVDFGFNGYIDTNLKWGAGAAIAVNATNDLIIYSDFGLKGKEKIFRLTEQDEVLYGNMHEYKWIYTERIGFTAVLLGINFTPKSVLNIICELYLSTNGFTPSEQSEFFNTIEDIYDYYDDPEVFKISKGLPASVKSQLKKEQEEQREGISDYYYGVLGKSLTKYSAFDFGMFFIFIKVSKEDIASTGIDLSLSSLTYIFDGSTMLNPEIQYHFIKYFSLIFSSNIFIGGKGSLFGEMPYTASMKFYFEINI